MKITLDLIRNVGGDWLVILDEKDNGGYECLFPDGKKIMVLIEEQLDWDSHLFIDSSSPDIGKYISEKQVEVAVRWIQDQRRREKILEAS